ncbi:MAG: PAS domain S-box protein [Sphingobacteriales bacterium]|nr:PAS domain S-box protein [Sphingobacteriales bacterium]
MSRQWQNIKGIINSGEKGKRHFLVLMDCAGTILSANALLIKKMHLPNPRSGKISFFDFVNPLHVDGFRQAIQKCGEGKGPQTTELYLKNGYYHPMKWEINSMGNAGGKVQTYLCIGSTLVDDERLNEFNRLSEKNYQLIVESINAGVLFQDIKGELIAANCKTAEIFGTTLERLYQLKDINSLWNASWTITSDQGQKILFDDTPFMKALRTGRFQQEVLVVRLRNGEDRWISFSSQPLFEEGQDIAYSVVSNITDITHEKELILELKERKAVFSAFMNKTPNLIWVVDETGNLVFASEAFYKYFGLQEIQSINRQSVDLVPASVTEALYDKHIQVLQSGMPLETVEKVKWADGTEFVFHINIFPIDSGTGRKMLGGHAVNLADKFRIEKQLKEANERLMMLSKATTDAIWEWDMQTGNIFRNDALMDMIGYQLERPKGLSWWLRRIHPEDRNRVSDKVKETTDKYLQSWEDEYRFKCADGNYKHMHDRGFVVYENGLPVRMIGSLQDMTHLKEMENLLMEEKLERQKEISETIIRVQEKERTRIGHELHDNVNQILSTVKLFIDMLDPSGKGGADLKEKSLDYLGCAIEEIRKLSKELVEPQLIGNGLVNSIQTLIDDIQLSNVIKIKFEHDNESELLSPGKKITLFRIVQEQIKNILKYSKAKNTVINLRSKEGETHLIIEDDGIGFDIKQTTRGIGLSNIYERTRFYDGKVNIEAAPGKGCKVEISIPVF